MWRENPLLQRELFYRLRLPGVSRSTLKVLGLIAVLLLLIVYWWVWRSIKQIGDYNAVLHITLMIEMILVVSGAPGVTSNVISREREQRTWDLLLVSLLEPHEILLGKLIGRTLPLLALLLLGLPLVLGCLIAQPANWSVALLGTLNIITTAVFFATGGLLASCLSQKTVTATSIAYLFAGFWVIGTIVLHELTALLWSSYIWQLEYWLLLNPLMVLSETFERYGPYASVPDGGEGRPWVLLIGYWLMTAGIIWGLKKTYRRWAFR